MKRHPRLSRRPQVRALSVPKPSFPSELLAVRLWMSLLIGLALAFLFILSASAAPDASQKGKVPPIESVQASMIKNMKLADFRLDGRVEVKKGKEKKVKYPVTLRTKGYTMVFEFKTQPLQIKLDLDPDNERTKIYRRPNGNAAWKPVTGRGKLESILNTDITYEDLALDFMKWDRIEKLGTDSIKTFPTWAYRAYPKGASKYAAADFWVSSDYYAFMQVDGLDKSNKVVKRVEVSDLQEVDGVWVLKEMLTTTFRPGTKLAKSRTWLYLSDAKKGASGL